MEKALRRARVELLKSLSRSRMPHEFVRDEDHDFDTLAASPGATQHPAESVVKLAGHAGILKIPPDEPTHTSRDAHPVVQYRARAGHDADDGRTARGECPFRTLQGHGDRAVRTGARSVLRQRDSPRG